VGLSPLCRGSILQLEGRPAPSGWFPDEDPRLLSLLGIIRVAPHGAHRSQLQGMLLAELHDAFAPVPAAWPPKDAIPDLGRFLEAPLGTADVTGRFCVGGGSVPSREGSEVLDYGLPGLALNPSRLAQLVVAVLVADLVCRETCLGFDVVVTATPTPHSNTTREPCNSLTAALGLWGVSHKTLFVTLCI